MDLQAPSRMHLSPPHLQEQHLNNNQSNNNASIGPQKTLQQTRLVQVQGNSYGAMPGTSQRRFNPYNNAEIMQQKRFIGETSGTMGIFLYFLIIEI